MGWYLEERPHNMLELRRTMRKIDWRLCLVADTEAAGTRNLVPIIQEAAEAGATLIQLRGKNCETREFLDLAFRTSEILKSIEIPLFINDRVDVALACGADGVHLGQQDMPLVYARKLMGKDRMIGISVNTHEEALEAVSGGADYVGAGPVFFTSSKEKIPAILGLEGLRSFRKKVQIPILAIGGITAENAGAVISTGVDGIAVISAVMGAKNITEAIGNLLKGWDPIRARS
jgi:thiamine-phosphate pyrophosphorylase